MKALAPLLVLTLALAGCNSPDASAEAPTPTTPAEEGASEAAAAPEQDEAEGVAQANADEVAPERYPGLLFQLLNAGERARFVELAGAELCPCSGGVESLDVCLQDAEVCELALQAGAVMMRMVKEGAQDVEVTDAVQQFVANARRVWEFELDDSPWVGAENPEIVLVNFSDFECPHCAEFTEAIDQVIEEHGDRVRVYFKQFPLPGHRNASAAALAALAAHQQGQFLPYHDLVFEHQTALTAAENPAGMLVALANQVGMNMERFTADANGDAVREQAARDGREGVEAGLQSTPTMFFDGVKMMDGYTVEGLGARVDARLAAIDAAAGEGSGTP